MLFELDRSNLSQPKLANRTSIPLPSLLIKKAVQVLDRIMDKNEDEDLFLQIRNEYFAHLSARDLFKYLQMIEKDLLLENFL